MKDHASKKAGTEDARALLRTGERVMRRLLDVFESYEQQLLAGNEISDTEMRRACLALGKAQSSLMEEIQKHERHALREDELIADAPIDMDAVRPSIGGQLDRIRQSRGTTGISEEPDAG